MAGAALEQRRAASQPAVGAAIPLSPRSEPLVTGPSVHAESNPTNEIGEAGRALALADFAPPAVGPGDALIRFAYRMGVSCATLARPFGKPARPRLLATVESSLTGDRSAGMALRAGHFLIHGVKLPVTQMDFSPLARLAPPVERTVHGFTWLDDLGSCAARAQCTATAERVLTAWLDANEAGGKRTRAGPAWNVEYAGWRLLGWLVHAPLILSGPDARLRGRVLSEMEATARWLDRNAGKARDGLGEVAGWSAVVAAGLLLPDGKPRRLHGEAGLIRALGELVADDGGVLSRSPLAQAEAITLLTALRACYRAVRRDPPDALETMTGLLVPPLLGLLHSDGGLGSWQGAGAVSAERISALVAASGVRTRPLKDARQWGYQRVTAGKSVLQFDAAPPPLARHARSGCASTLAFEFSHGSQRLIVNCGGAAFAGGQVPARIEQGLRGTAAHSTLVLDNANSTAVLLHGKLGAGVGEVEIDRRVLALENGGATRLEASHDGYVSRHGLLHRRILILRDDGAEMRGEDLLVPAGRRGKRGKIAFAIRFHVGPGIEMGLSKDGRGAGLSLPDGSYWQFRIGKLAEGVALSIEESLWVDGQGRPQPIEQIVLHGLTPRSGGSFSWLLKKMG
ncbi:heparinase [Altererythrobacter aerius]|uniref:Heparinase n=1 Tax=Tsuneonella aeria TaxID=1837929 RepID=A0A6I4TE36_9SPHN|nr:heparinase II/III family protein [Tsuneonella aeria]MXO75323.1 heparinase [Tsuneonella aeria]